jgi:hypothetical protein
MRIIRASIAACLGVFALSGTAQAEFMFQFDQSSYEVTAGEAFDVQLYFVETGTSILNTLGLVSAATKLTYNEAPFASDPAQIGSLADVVYNPAFNFTAGLELIQATGSSAGTVSLPLGTFTPVMPEAATPDRILLGTFTFTAGSVVGEVTSLSASILANSTQTNFVTGGTNPQVLDSLISGGEARILVVPSGGVVIPEPTSVVMAGLGLSVALGSVIRRRRLARS